MQIARWGLTVTCFEVTYIIGPVELVQPGNDDVVRCAGLGCTGLEGLLGPDIYERIQGNWPNLTSCPLTHLPILAAA